MPFVRIFRVPPFMTPASGAALRKAVASVEAASAVELLVVVRPKSESYRHVDLSVGMAMALLMLAFLLYSPWPFAWHFFLLNTIVMALGMSVVSSKIPALQRVLSKQRTMDQAVRREARAAFVELGVHHTQYRTGAVLYVSLLERSAALVPDSAVELAFPRAEWRALEEKLTSLLRAGHGAGNLARAIESSAELFAIHLPRHAEDQNELPDAVVQ